MPLVSVIMPVYNCEGFLADSIESVLNQTYEDFELIILNDGSTDTTWDIVRNYGDSRIFAIYNDDDNLKIPRRRNMGIKMAQGKYVAIQDGDDISLPDRFQLQVDFLEEHDDVFCVGGHADKIDHRGNVIGEMTYPPESHEEIRRQYESSPTNPIIDPTTMYRRKDFLEIGGYSEENDIYTVPDLDLWGRAILAGKRFSNLMVKLIQYRMNVKGMTMLHKNEMIRSHVAVIKKYHKALSKSKLRKDEYVNEETR